MVNDYLVFTSKGQLLKNMLLNELEVLSNRGFWVSRVYYVFSFDSPIR
jgi:hypothetical protein